MSAPVTAVDAVKFKPAILAVLIVALWVEGPKLNALLLTVTVYDPAGKPVKL